MCFVATVGVANLSESTTPNLNRHFGTFCRAGVKRGESGWQNQMQIDHSQMVGCGNMMAGMDYDKCKTDMRTDVRAGCDLFKQCTDDQGPESHSLYVVPLVIPSLCIDPILDPVCSPEQQSHRKAEDSWGWKRLELSGPKVQGFPGTFELDRTPRLW